MPSELIKSLIDKINNPDRFVLNLEDVEYLVRPMSARSFHSLSERFGSMFAAILDVSKQDSADGQPILESAGLSASVLRHAPQVIELIRVPLVTAMTEDACAIIGEALRRVDTDEPVGKEWAEKNLFTIQRARIIYLIYEAEGIEYIMGEVRGLREIVQPEEKPLSPLTDEDSTWLPPELPSLDDIRPMSHLRSRTNSPTSKSSSSSTVSSMNESQKQERPVRSSRRKRESKDPEH